MRGTTIGSLLLLVACACGTTEKGSRHGSDDPPADTASAWIFDRVDGSTLVFADGKVFNTGLHDLKYIGQVPREGFAPYLIFSGDWCANCVVERGLYVHSPSDGAVNTSNGHDGQHYPGRIHRADGKVYYQARAFFGDILPGIRGVVWYITWTLDDGRVASGAALVNLSDPMHHDVSVFTEDRLHETLALMAEGRCQEIPGIEQTVPPRTIGGGMNDLLHH